MYLVNNVISWVPFALLLENEDVLFKQTNINGVVTDSYMVFLLQAQTSYLMELLHLSRIKLEKIKVNHCYIIYYANIDDSISNHPLFISLLIIRQSDFCSSLDSLK